MQRARRLVIWVGLILLLFAPVVGRGRPAAAEEKAIIAPPALVGTKVNIVLASKEQIADAEVLTVQQGEVPGTIQLLKIRDPASNEKRPLMAMMVRSLTPSAGGKGYVFDQQSRRLLPDDPATSEQLRAALEAAAAAKKARSDGPPAGNSTPRPADKEKADKDKKAKKKEKSEDEELELRPGVARWPTLSKEEMQAAVKEHKEHLEEVKKLFPQMKFSFFETDYFLFLSDLGPQDLRLYVPHMDNMYKYLLKFFDHKAGTNIWRGKAVVIIFNNDQAYLTYEKKFFDYEPSPGAKGLCHADRKGNVLTSMRTTGIDQRRLAYAIVHETTHGFIWRYKTNGNIPNWVNEGLAEYVADKVVPGVRAVDEAITIRTMQRSGTLGGDFFGQRIPGKHYGTALNITRFMIGADNRKYTRFLNLLKSGLTDDEALAEVYGIRREALIVEYGRKLGIPNLKP